MAASSWLGPAFRGPAQRVVSLVPSLTDAVFELGVGEQLVGRTRFCVRPVGGVDAVEVVGGTKDPDVERIRELAPDLVLANREENTRARMERIAESTPVLLTDPTGPREVPALWRELGEACGCEEEAAKRGLDVERLLGETPQSGAHALSFVYWIWRDPWMAAGRDTYISELLVAAGWRNALSAELRRYPKLDPKQALALRPDAMLFSSEPFDFALPRDLDVFPRGTRASDGTWRLPNGARALSVDGQLLSWYPSLTAGGLRYAAALRTR
jgi:ABC-type Fe3+-hydroxamate transport system substrate-binding protein